MVVSRHTRRLLSLRKHGHTLVISQDYLLNNFRQVGKVNGGVVLVGLECAGCIKAALFPGSVMVRLHQGESLYLLLNLFLGHNSNGLCGCEKAGWVCRSPGHVEGASLLGAFHEESRSRR